MNQATKDQIKWCAVTRGSSFFKASRIFPLLMTKWKAIKIYHGQVKQYIFVGAQLKWCVWVFCFFLTKSTFPAVHPLQITWKSRIKHAQIIVIRNYCMLHSRTTSTRKAYSNRVVGRGWSKDVLFILFFIFLDEWGLWILSFDRLYCMPPSNVQLWSGWKQVLTSQSSFVTFDNCSSLCLYIFIFCLKKQAVSLHATGSFYEGVT